MKSVLGPVGLAVVAVAVLAAVASAGTPGCNDCQGGFGAGYAPYGSCGYADSLWAGYCDRPDWPIGHSWGCGWGWGGCCGGLGCGGGCCGCGCPTWWYGYGAGAGLGRCCGTGCGLGGCRLGLFRRSYAWGMDTCCDSTCCASGLFPAGSCDGGPDGGNSTEPVPAEGAPVELKSPTEESAAEPTPEVVDEQPTSGGLRYNDPTFDAEEGRFEPSPADPREAPIGASLGDEA